MSDINAAVETDARDTTPTRDTTGEHENSFSSVEAAVAEMDRRAAERKATRKA